MIKPPIDSHLFSPLRARDAGHRCYGRPRNENERQAACASIYIRPPSRPSGERRLVLSVLVAAQPKSDFQTGAPHDEMSRVSLHLDLGIVDLRARWHHLDVPLDFRQTDTATRNKHVRGKREQFYSPLPIVAESRMLKLLIIIQIWKSDVRPSALRGSDQRI